MYYIKFKDYTTRSYKTTFGSCDLCFHTGTVVEPTFKFNLCNENGKVVETVDVQGWYWSWGDYQSVRIDNVIRFAEWFDSQKFTCNSAAELNYNKLEDWAYDFEEYEYELNNPSEDDW